MPRIFTGGANGLAGFATSLPRGPVLLVTVWICLIAGVLLYAGCSRARLGKKAHLLREAPLLAATLGIDGAAWRFVALRRGRRAGRTGRRLLGRLERRRFAGSDRLFDHGAVPDLGACWAAPAIRWVRCVGAALAVGLPELLRDLQGAWLLAYAVATLAVVLWAPEGLAGLIDRLRGARRACRPAGPADVGAADRPVRSGSSLDGVSGNRFGGVRGAGRRVACWWIAARSSA